MIGGGRCGKGIAVGMFSAILPVYVSEVFPPTKKGLATSILQWSLTWGILIMFYVSYVCNFMESDTSFRIAWGFEIIPGLSLIISSIFIPESPKWLSSKSQWEKARKVMDGLKLREEARNEPPEGDQDLDNIEKVLDNYENRFKKCTYRDLFRRRLFKHLLIGVTTQVFTQLSGISVLMYYLIYICEMIGLTGDIKMMSASIQYLVNVIFTIFPILWLDNMRRKDVFVFGAGSLGLCITTIGCVMGVYGHSVPPIGGNESVVWEVSGTPGSLCLALCFLFVAIFASTLSCASWLYTNEIFPVHAKAKGSAICMSVSWIINFILTFLAPASLKHIKWGTFLVFGAFCLTGAFIIGFCFPETYKLSEEQIEDLYKFNDVEKNDPSDPDIELVGAGRSKREVCDEDPTSSLKDDEVVVIDVDDGSDKEITTKNFSTSERSKPYIPSHMDLHHSIIQKTSSVGTSNSVVENVSPFLKKIGGPFENDSELSALEHNVEGTGGEDSTTYTDGLISQYYNRGTNDSPFLNNLYQSSPFK